jgi:glycosyltransferase involved in cell wall biosynthesis
MKELAQQRNMSVNNLTNLVSIGIATKNRWQDLEITLNKIAEAGLNHIKILIFDDNSDSACPFNWQSFPLNIDLQRFSESKGYIVRRNQLAQTMKTKYYLSLDDDSFPVSGSLAAAIEFAESCPDIYCLSFPIYNPVWGCYQNRSYNTKPYQVRSFVGCGHLLNRAHFLSLGGYREELVHQVEELEFAARAFQAKLYCYHFPDFEIVHTASNNARSSWRCDFYSARNNVLWNDWFVPNQLEIIKQSRNFIYRTYFSIKTRRLASLEGQFAGLKNIGQYKKYRQRMSLEVFRNWRSLPGS